MARNPAAAARAVTTAAAGKPSKRASDVDDAVAELVARGEANSAGAVELRSDPLQDAVAARALGCGARRAQDRAAPARAVCLALGGGAPARRAGRGAPPGSGGRCARCARPVARTGRAARRRRVLCARDSRSGFAGDARAEGKGGGARVRSRRGLQCAASGPRRARAQADPRRLRGPSRSRRRSGNARGGSDHPARVGEGARAAPRPPTRATAPRSCTRPTRRFARSSI